jgi:hypothetical protein
LNDKLKKIEWMKPIFAFKACLFWNTVLHKLRKLIFWGRSVWQSVLASKENGIISHDEWVES